MLLEILRRWVQHDPATDRETLMRRLLEHYGFTVRLTTRRREYLAKVLALLQRQELETTSEE